MASKGVMDYAAIARLGKKLKKIKGVFPPLRPYVEPMKKVNRFRQTQFVTPHPPVTRTRRGTLFSSMPKPREIALRWARPFVQSIRKMARSLDGMIKKGRKGGGGVRYRGKRRGVMAPLRWNSGTNKLEPDYTRNPFIAY